MGGTRMFRRATTVAVLATLLLVPLLAVIGPVGAQTGSSAPRGWVDRIQAVNGGIDIAGWAVDMDRPSDAVTVHVYANGGYVDGRRASANRPDVNAALGVTGGHGFGWTVPLGAGFWDVCVYAIGVGGGGDTNLGCRSVTIGGAAATDVQSRLRQLGYWHTDQPGNFGAGTEHALTALQKVAGIPRTGVVDEPTRKALADGVRPAARSSQGRVIEVDLARQVLMVVVNGRVETILDTATGKASTPTPPGAFEVYRAVDAWDPGPYGSLYRPRYFVGGVAVHGFGSVPEQPASHGCVRVTLEAMDWIWANNVMPLGTDVWVY